MVFLVLLVVEYSDADADVDTDAGRISSLFSFLWVVIDASGFPTAHEFDPVEWRSAVPALDEDRASEACREKRRLAPQVPAVGGVAVAGAGLSPKRPHLTPSDARYDTVDR